MGVHREHMRRRLGLAVPSSTNMMMAEARPHRHAAEQNVVIRTEAQASAYVLAFCAQMAVAAGMKPLKTKNEFPGKMRRDHEGAPWYSGPHQGQRGRRIQPVQPGSAWTSCAHPENVLSRKEGIVNAGRCNTCRASATATCLR